MARIESDGLRERMRRCAAILSFQRKGVAVRVCNRERSTAVSDAREGGTGEARGPTLSECRRVARCRSSESRAEVEARIALRSLFHSSPILALVCTSQSTHRHTLSLWSRCAAAYSHHTTRLLSRRLTSRIAFLPRPSPAPHRQHARTTQQQTPNANDQSQHYRATVAGGAKGGLAGLAAGAAGAVALQRAGVQAFTKLTLPLKAFAVTCAASPLSLPPERRTAS